MEVRKVTIRLTEDLLGTVPSDKNLYENYIESKKPENVKDNETETVPENLDVKGYTTFHRDEKGFFVYDYLIKGFFKNAGNIMKETVGVKQLKSKLSDFFFVTPRKIHLGKDKADGLLERPLRAQTPQGQRVSIARSDFVAAGTVLTFEVRWLQHKEIDEDLIRQLLDYGQFQGLGQFRNGGYGRFEVVSFEKVKE